MLRLPGPQTRALSQSFWLVSSLLAGLFTSGILWLLGAPQWVWWGALFGAVSALPGWWKPEVAGAGYHIWDRLAHFVARGARLWVTGICFLIVAIAGRAGSRLSWRRPLSADSGWRRRATLSRATYTSQSDVPGDLSPRADWIRPLLSWSRASGSTWVWALVPFLLLLSAVQGRHTGSMGGDVYTLY